MSTINKLLGRNESSQSIDEMATRKDFIAMAKAISAIENPAVRKQHAEETANVFAQTNPLFDRSRYMQACGVATGMGTGGSPDVSKEAAPSVIPARESIVSKILGRKVEEALEVCDVVHMICGAAGEDKEALKKGLSALSKGQLKRVYNAITGKDTLKDSEGEEGEGKKEDDKGPKKEENKEAKKEEPKEQKKEEPKKVPFASGEENKSEK